MDKTTEYLRLLQEKNRLKKMMATKSKDEQAKEELEKGFTTHFQGAHAVKDSKMPVPTKVTSVVKPLNIMGRFAKGANMMWGGEKKNGVLSPQKLACSDDQTEKDIPVSRNFAPDSSKHEDRNYQSEYESDFDDCSDVETDPKSNASIWKEKRGLPLPSLLEDDDTFFIDHGKTAIGDAKDAAGHVVAKDNNPLNMSVALDSTLQTRVKDLSAQQKLKLLKMLEHDLRDDVEANSPVDCDTSPPIANLDVTQADQRQGRKGPVNQQEEPVRQDAHSPHLLPQYPENIPLTFRIRIVSTWSSNAKFVSLGAIRLRLQGSDSSDLLPTLTTKVCSGLVPLATGSECMRALPQLLGNSGARRPSSAYRGSVSAVWKGPFSAESPLEFQFSGELPVSMMHGGGLENLELLLWNSESPPLNSSSARDVDVFVGNRCVWSGQLDEYDDGDATTGNMARRPGELAPTLAIFPWRSDSSAKPSNNTNIATKNNGKTESSAAINISKSELRETMTPTRDHRPGNDQPDWLVQQRPRNLPADDLLGDDYSLAHSPQRRTGEEPSLRRRRKEGGVDLETKVAESSTFGSPKKRVSTAGKRVSKALAKSVEAEEYAVETGTRQRESQSGAEVEDADNAAVTTNSNVSTTAAKRRATRRDRNHLIKELQLDRDDFVAGGQAMIEVSGGGFSPQRSVTAKQLREAELKKSIDSMAFNDKFNLGRLSASKLPLVRSTIETEENAGEHHLMEISGTLDDSLGRPTTPIISSSSVRDPTQLTADQAYGSPQRKLGRRDASSSALLGLAAGDTLTRAARDSDRTAKIDLVQEKITSTIADLAKIMSALPAGGISFGKPDLSKIDSPIQEAALLSEDFNVSTPPRTLASRPVIGTAVTEKASPKTAKEKDAAKVKPWHKKDAASSALKLSDPTTTVSSLRTLVIEIDSNWGDANYVGLNGVELYDRAGGVIQLNGAGGKGAGVRAITAFPRDLADLPQHKDDPRKVQNLLNGVNFTKNDLHSWLTPHVQLLKQADGDASSASATALPYIAKVVMELEPGVTPVMCRIFNYNRSRTRNQRGVKHFKLIMDDSILFEGDLKRASGQLQSEESESETVFLDITLTDADKTELRTHLVRRERFEGEVEDEELGEASGDMDQLEQSWAELSVARPRTSAGVVPPPAQSADISVNSKESAQQQHKHQDEHHHQFVPSALATPFESAFSSYPPVESTRVAPSKRMDDSNLVDSVPSMSSVPEHQPSSMAQPESRSLSANRNSGQNPSRMMVSASCKVLRLDLQSTWGDTSYVGLCGLEVLIGPDFAPAKIGAHQLKAQPKDLSEIGCYDDPRVLGNLVNGINNTGDDTAMWIIPFTSGSQHFIEIDLLKVCDVVGIRVWNYNKATEQVLRGCRHLAVSADGRHLFQCLLRMGPGSDGVSFGQTILFCEVADILQNSHPQYAPFSRNRPGQQKETRLTSYMSPAIRQDFETPFNPTGLLWKFTFFDNWNDGYYIGLDAIEFFDMTGRLIDATAVGAQVQAVPYSAQDVAPPHASSKPEDPRVPSQLFQRASTHRQPHQCWLAPLSRCMTPVEKSACVRRVLGDQAKNRSAADANSSFPLNNVLYVLFQHPIAVSAIRFFNYSKTPTRGVRDFQVEVDGLYLYMGSLLRADREKMTPQIISKAGAPINAATSEKIGVSRGQSVLFTNDPKIIQTHRDTVSYCGAGEQDLLCINERQVMVRSKNMYDQEPPNTSLEGVRADLDKRPMTAAAWK